MALLTFKTFFFAVCKVKFTIQQETLIIYISISLTCDPLNKILGWSILEDFVENITCWACFVWSGLKDIFYWYAHLQIILRSSLALIAEILLRSWVIENRDVSSANSFTLSNASLIKIRKKMWSQNQSLRYTSLNTNPMWTLAIHFQPFIESTKFPYIAILSNLSINSSYPILKKWFCYIQKYCLGFKQRKIVKSLVYFMHYS